MLVHRPRTNNVLAMYWVSTSPLAPSVSKPLVPSVLICAMLVACVAVCVHLSHYSVVVARQSALTYSAEDLSIDLRDGVIRQSTQ